MKKMIKLMAMMALACTMFGITGCGANSPDGVVKDFLKTAQAGKLDQAYLESHVDGFTEEIAKIKKLAGDDKKKVDEQVKVAIDQFNKMVAKEGKDTKFSIAETKLDGDNATVSVKFEKDGKENKHDIPVKKINGKWMLSFK